MSADTEDRPICERCNGSGEGCADGVTCFACRGHGVAIDRQAEEDRAAAHADYLYDREKDARAEREGPS